MKVCAHFVDGEPYRREGDQPEEEEAHHVSGRYPSGVGETIRYAYHSQSQARQPPVRGKALTDVFHGRPDGSKHDDHARASDGCLHTIPDTVRYEKYDYDQHIVEWW